MFMIKNIIIEITADKKARNIEPTHATFKEVYDIAVSKGLSASDVRNGLIELYLAGEIKVGDTLNDKYIRVL
jgi:predicted Rossmann fold nucleotide-binding protein DprA/Smf involved in DNA uptake